jgi:hypothetical protein
MGYIGPSTLSWSFSRKTHFDSCKRHYFYYRFWMQDAKIKWLLYEMRYITTLTMMRGAVIHEVIAQALRSLKDGVKVTAEEARSNVTQLLRERYMESQKRLWHIDNRPPGRKISQITNLLEHYYRFPDTVERAKEAQQVAWHCIDNLIGSELWREIASSDNDNWKEIDDGAFPSFDLDGIKVYATIDFAYLGDKPTIIDWKTGTPSEQDRRQLTVYSLYAEWKWGWVPTQTRLAAVYLQPRLMVDDFSPSVQDVASVKQEVKDSFAEMLELEPAYGPANIDDFPLTEDTNHCRWCRFQGICEGARRLSG